ncbi:MAG: hypothetical protein LCH41_14010 [Armatimonadetes bacterium]|nr:hypothetical protein [Armatimonadota bacterium]
MNPNIPQDDQEFDQWLRQSMVASAPGPILRQREELRAAREWSAQLTRIRRVSVGLYAVGSLAVCLVVMVQSGMPWWLIAVFIGLPVAVLVAVVLTLRARR